MALTQSKDLPMGTLAPSFKLLEVSSKQMLDLEKIRSPKATVIMFICNHCPYVIHIQKELLRLVYNYQSQGVSFCGISANDPIHYPDDAPEKMQEIAEKFHYPFPYLFDEDQKVAKAYGAECTPEFFVFDKNLQLRYHGRFDDSSPGKEILPSGKDLAHVLDCLLRGETKEFKTMPSMGCSIKWKAKA
ncbi:MAG: thioredoxin family protein [Oligoflexia bacterium]|nr:thioredoxin family protein [Oligoflexia bacterium]